MLQWSTTWMSHRVHRINGPVLKSWSLVFSSNLQNTNLFTSFSMVKRWFILILSQCHIINAAACLGFLFSSPRHLACPQSTRSRRCNSTSTINRQNTPFFSLHPTWCLARSLSSYLFDWKLKLGERWGCPRCPGQ